MSDDKSMDELMQEAFDDLVAALEPGCIKAFEGLSADLMAMGPNSTREQRAEAIAKHGLAGFVSPGPEGPLEVYYSGPIPDAFGKEQP